MSLASCHGLAPPFGEYKTSFTDECAALTISPPSLLGSLRFEKALCIEEQPPLDTALRTQRIAAAARLQWLARQPRGVIRSNWPGPSPMAARFVRSMVARSYNAGRRGTGPLFEAAVACEIATMDERLVDPLPSPQFFPCLHPSAASRLAWTSIRPRGWP